MCELSSRRWTLAKPRCSLQFRFAGVDDEFRSRTSKGLVYKWSAIIGKASPEPELCGNTLRHFEDGVEIVVGKKFFPTKRRCASVSVLASSAATSSPSASTA
jgi:hypothetical protein